MPPDELPAASMVGANTMGCLVNGEVWLPQRPGLIGDGLVYDISFDFTGGLLNLQAQRQFPELAVDESLSFAVSGILGEGQYTHADVLGVEHRVGADLYELVEDSEQSICVVGITRLDMVEEVLSGTFEFDLVNINAPTDTVRVRQGRFDLSAD